MPTPTIKSRRDENADATRDALLSAGRALFSQHGYHTVGVEAIARDARVTRGAFYHHFADKRAVLDALVLQLHAEAAAAVERAARRQDDTWARIAVGIDAYIATCAEAAFHRLVLQEAPAVLGAARFREIDDIFLTRLMIVPMAALQHAGELEVDDVNLFGRLIGAMIWEVSALLPDAADPAAMRASAVQMIMRTLSAFRPPAR
jgi:AcrR family transcriptional regulator